MRAAVLGTVGAPLEIETLTAIDPGPKEVRVRIDASGVCHSDVTVASGKVPMPPPVILGHEGAGTVLEVGKDVTRVKVGDRVIGAFVPACGNCWFCLRDQSNFCERMIGLSFAPHSHRANGDTIVGMSGLGTFADEMTVHEWSLVPVETDLPAAQLALVGCAVMTGVGAALNTAQVEPGSTVAVIGCGGIGQSIIQGARIAGAARIIAIDPVAFKRSAATGFGATDGIDPADGPVPDQVKSLTGGRGADYVFEAVGSSATIVTARDSTRSGGTVTCVGMSPYNATVELSAYSLFAHEKRLLGCNYGSASVRRDFPKMVRLAESHQLDLGAMVSREIKLEDVNEAFRAMQAGEVVRSVIVNDTGATA
jgi:S-(hydroxymethyl)glutathione dehydrogenase/alcohol dehydrogenase